MSLDHIPQLRPEDLSQLPAVSASEPGLQIVAYDQDNQARMVRVPASTFTPAAIGAVSTAGTTAYGRSLLALANQAALAAEANAGLVSAVDSTLTRAALQFDGTNYPIIEPVALPGTGDFSFAAFVNPLAGEAGALAPIGGDTGAFALRIAPTGSVSVSKVNVADVGATAAGAATLGQWSHVAYVRAAGIGKFYVNGAVVHTIVDATDYSVPSNYLGARYYLSEVFKGFLARAAFLNVALSAPQIAALANDQLGVLPVELQRGANTRNTSVFTTPGGDAFSTFTGATAMGFTAAGLTGRANSTNFPALAGQVCRVSFTAVVTSGTIAVAVSQSNLGGEISAAYAPVVTGTNSVLFTITSNSPTGLANIVFRPGAVGAVDFSISNFRVDVLGATFLQPDADQGAGPVLRANYGRPDIVLPADGHTAGGVYRAAPLLGPVNVAIPFNCPPDETILALGADVQRVPPGWAVVGAMVRAPALSGIAVVELGTTYGGDELGSTAVAASGISTISAPPVVFQAGTRLYISVSDEGISDGLLILSIAPFTP